MVNKRHKEARKTNPLLRYEIDYDETKEEIIKYLVNRKGVDMNRFIKRDRSKDLIRGVNAMLNYRPEDK